MPEPPRYGNCIGFRIAKKVIETLIISMGPYVPPVGFSSTLLPGRSIIGMADNQPSGHRNKPPKMSDLDGSGRNLGLFMTDQLGKNTHPLTPRPGTPIAAVPALTRCLM